MVYIKCYSSKYSKFVNFDYIFKTIAIFSNFISQSAVKAWIIDICLVPVHSVIHSYIYIIQAQKKTLTILPQLFMGRPVPLTDFDLFGYTN